MLLLTSRLHTRESKEIYYIPSSLLYVTTTDINLIHA